MLSCLLNAPASFIIKRIDQVRNDTNSFTWFQLQSHLLAIWIPYHLLFYHFGVELPKVKSLSTWTNKQFGDFWMYIYNLTSYTLKCIYQNIWHILSNFHSSQSMTFHNFASQTSHFICETNLAIFHYYLQINLIFHYLCKSSTVFAYIILFSIKPSHDHSSFIYHCIITFFNLGCQIKY